MLGHHGHGGEQGQRFEIGDELGRAGERIDVRIANDIAVGKEHQVEFGALGSLGDLDIVVDVDMGVFLRPRVPPRGHMMARRVVIGPKGHLAALSHCALPYPSCREAPEPVTANYELPR